MAAKKQAVQEKSVPASSTSAKAKDLIEKLRKRGVIITPASEAVQAFKKRFPTGLLSLDTALRGGFPAAGIIQIVGEKNSGKTWLALQVIRCVQQILGDKARVLYALTELGFDKDQARKAGVVIPDSAKDLALANQVRKERGIPPLSKEEIKERTRTVGTFDLIDESIAENLYDAVLGFVELNSYDVIVIDSLGNLMSDAEEDGSMEDQQRGGISRQNAKFSRKLTQLLGKPDADGVLRDPCIITINHVRYDFNNPGAVSIPGGKALEHMQFINLLVTPGRQEQEQQSVQSALGTVKKFKPQWVETNWKMLKAKAGTHGGQTGSWIFNYATGNADFINDTIACAISADIIDMGAGGNYSFQHAGEDVRVRGRETLVEWVRADLRKCQEENRYEESFFESVRDRVFQIHGIEVSYDWGA